MKVIVDQLPKTSKECIFAECIQMTSKYKCMFQHGLYSRCNLDCNMECPYLKKKEDDSVSAQKESLSKAVQKMQAESFAESEMEKLAHVVKGEPDPSETCLKTDDPTDVIWNNEEYARYVR